MRVKVLIPFRDANDFKKAYGKGEVVEFADARATELMNLRLVAPVEEEGLPKESPKATEVAPEGEVPIEKKRRRKK